MYDAIVIGSRCAGAPTAMLLARRGRRVLVVDRALFPSDVLSGHTIQPAGWPASPVGACSTGSAPPAPRSCPRSASTSATSSSRVSPVPVDGIDAAVCIRRTVIDPLLDRRRRRSRRRDPPRHHRHRAGPRRRPGRRHPRPRRRRPPGSRSGRRSSSAPTAPTASSPAPSRRRAYHVRPATHLLPCTRTGGASTSTASSSTPGPAGSSSPRRPTTGSRSSPSRSPSATPPATAAGPPPPSPRPWPRCPASRPASRRGAGRAVPVRPPHDSFFRQPAGPGWALVGDAGYHKDPITAQGMLDAFRDAELLAEAIDDGLDGDLARAMRRYQHARDAAALPMYELTCGLADLEQPPRAGDAGS